VTKYIGQRLLQLIPVVFLVSFVSFGIIFLLPGDPALMILGDQGMIDKQMYDATRKELGLNDPIPIQYLNWLGRTLHGDLGTSTRDHEPIVKGLLARLPVTLELGALSLILAIVVAVPGGILAAMKPNSAWDVGVSVFSLLGVAMPSFWLAILLIYGLAVNLRFLPPSGYESFATHPVENLRLMILPAVTLGWGLAGVLMRQVQSSMLEVLQQEYVITAWAKGLPQGLVIMRHALKNALIPIITVAGLLIGRLLGGAVIIETIFGLPAVGRWAVDSILYRDFPVVQAVTLVLAVGVLLSNLLADVLYSVVDPRIAQ
jgi:peptide/nickel transport system permease protein